jgi:hypothetical protein
MEKPDMSSLTLDKLLETMRKFPPPPEDPLSISSLMRPRPLGMDVIAEPDVPVLQLSKQCAELVGPEFAASVNTWLLARFGLRPPVAKTPLLLYGTKLVMNSRDYGRFIKLCS